MAVTLTTEQFQELLSRIPAQSKLNKNFTRCNLIYGGERDYNKVDAFVTGVTIYKQIEGISDEDALAGLPLLLKDNASTWWTGINSEIKTWSAALNAIRSAFAPKLQAYEVYIQLFSDNQGESEPIDTFLCRKRALLGMLPAKRHKEEEQVDFVYGLLKMEFKRKVARTEIKSFSDLIEKARHLEALERAEKQPTKADTTEVPKKNIERCLYCRRKGHTIEVCRLRLRQEQPKADQTPPASASGVITKSPIKCYGCGAPGVIRSNCEVCKAKESPSKPVKFYLFGPTLQSIAKVPTIEIIFNKQLGHAYIDTGALSSVAGKKLHHLMINAGIKGTPFKSLITLADGSKKSTELLTVAVNIKMGHKTLPIQFTVFPDADTRTLLGIDFLETNGVVLDLGQRVWYYYDEPEKKYDFLRVQNEDLLSARRIDFEESEEPLSDFMAWATNLKMLSPIPNTPDPSPKQDIEAQESSPEKEIAQESTPGQQTKPPELSTWKLIKMDSPPPPVRPREPRGIEDNLPEDPRITYLPINPIKLYSLDISLEPHEATYLTNSEKEQVNNLLNEFQDIFNTQGDPTPFAEHKIETGNHKPIALKPYRLSPIRQKQLKDKLDEMLKNNIIKECESPWAAPVVLVPKGDTDIRVCIDYRKLNAITTPDRYPLPRMDDLLQQAKAMPYMTTIDLQSGYWQIKIDENDQNKSCFVTVFGTFMFLRMPFGLRNAPSTFQRLMDKFCRELKAESVFAYLDDLICRSPNFKQHLDDLREIFTRLRYYKLRANRNKCNLACATIKYLGHLITPEGIKTDPDKTKAISELPEPKNLKQLISFLQTASWYRRFIRNFAEVARPLTNLTRKNIAWKWEEPQQTAFNMLKEALTTTPVLKQLDSDAPYIIKTDASNYAIGAALVQGEGEKEHPIEYASRLLTSAERNYTVTEKEALAIVWAVTKFRGYIEGTKFLTITDHQPLKWLMNLKSPTGRLARWALQLQPYDFETKYTPGRTNVVADSLSRPPCEEHIDPCEICRVEFDLPKREEHNIRDEQMKDENLRSVIKTLEENEGSENNIQSLKRGYLMHNGVLYRFTPDQEDDNAKLVIPHHEVPNVLKQFHDSQTSGHYGAERTTKRIEKNFFWKGLRKDQILSPVYHPEPNIVERKNRDLKTQIGIMVKDKHYRWPETLPTIRFAMNSAYNQTDRPSRARAKISERHAALYKKRGAAADIHSLASGLAWETASAILKVNQ
ncbi:uncharacterized protein LOC134662604 [Cydia amplana]|uniref:uncharacterized protein LOC134662604 n=1 Tax=Cydia amplana TaxID=1869771 RepID=UPI002FE63C8F